MVVCTHRGGLTVQGPQPTRTPTRVESVTGPGQSRATMDYFMAVVIVSTHVTLLNGRILTFWRKAPQICALISRQMGKFDKQHNCTSGGNRR